MRRRWSRQDCVWQQDVLCACQSLTKDQDLCDTSVLNLQQRLSVCLCLYLGSWDSLPLAASPALDLPLSVSIFFFPFASITCLSSVFSLLPRA